MKKFWNSWNRSQTTSLHSHLVCIRMRRLDSAPSCEKTPCELFCDLEETKTRHLLQLERVGMWLQNHDCMKSLRTSGDRKSVVAGTRVFVRVDLGGRRIL